MTAPITKINPRGIDTTGDFVVNSLSSTGNVSAGNVKTDHLLYANGTAYSFATNAAGSNTQIQFNDGNSFAGNANLTFNKVTGTLTVAHITSDGANVSNVNALTLNGHSDTYFATSAQGSKADTAIQSGANVSVFTNDSGYLVAANLSTYATQSYVGNAISNLVASAPAALDTLNELANALGNDASYSTTITNALANKLSTTNFSSTANTWISTQSTSNLSEGTNLYYTVARANSAIDARVTKSFVDNLAVVANISNIAYSVAGANVSGQVGNALVAGTVYTNAQPNITSVGTLTSLSVTGNVTGNYFLGDGSQLTGIISSSGNATNANYANYAGNVVNASQPNITTVGSLTSLTVTGNATVGNLITSGNITTGGGTGGSITGAYLISANYFVGAGNGLSSLTGANVTGQVGNALIAGTVYTAAQPNITSVGTLSSLNVTGNITAGNVAGGNLVSANYVSGNGSLLTSITGANVSGAVAYATTANAVAGANVTGQVANALVAGTVFTAAQPNITSVGTLNSLTVTGNITAGNVAGGNLVSASYISGNGSLLTSIAGANVTGQVANALVAGTVYTNAQPNITSVGTLASVEITGNANVGATLRAVDVIATGNIVGGSGTGGNISGANVITANYFVGNGSLLTGLPSGYANSNVANYLPTYTGNFTAGNILTDHLLYANGTAYAFSSNASGSNTQIQFNDGNSFAGNAGLTFNKTTTTLTANNFVSTTSANLGAVSNVHITGGSSNQLLQTDGSGNLTWVTPTGSTITVDNFTGNGVQTAFTLSSSPSSAAYTIVALAGTIQPRSVYTVSGTTLTFSSPPPNPAPIEVTTFTSVLGYGSGNITANVISANTLTANTLSGNIISSNTNLTVNTLTANSVVNGGSGTPTLQSNTSIVLPAATVVRVSTSPMQFYTCTTTVRDTIAASNGYVIYNTSTNKLQVYANGAWADLN